MSDASGGPTEPDRSVIESAIEAKAFTMVYQPIVQLDTGVLAGVEALCRCADGTPPDVWFDACERLGLASDMDAVVVELVLGDFAQLPPGYVAVNLSATTLATASPRLLDLVGRAAEQRQLVLELTEHAAVDDYPATTASISTLRKAGVLFAVDDAGAGHSTFRHIVHLGPDIIKLDRSITERIDGDAIRRALVGSLVIFAGEVGAVVVAEGIETKEELATVRAAGVSCGQGFGLARPQPLPLAPLTYEPVPFVELVAGDDEEEHRGADGRTRGLDPVQAASRMRAVVASMAKAISMLRQTDGTIEVDEFRALTAALSRQVSHLGADLDDVLAAGGRPAASTLD